MLHTNDTPTQNYTEKKAQKILRMLWCNELQVTHHILGYTNMKIHKEVNTEDPMPALV